MKDPHLPPDIIVDPADDEPEIEEEEDTYDEWKDNQI
jgi:hypothetical protein